MVQTKVQAESSDIGHEPLARCMRMVLGCFMHLKIVHRLQRWATCATSQSYVIAAVTRGMLLLLLLGVRAWIEPLVHWCLFWYWHAEQFPALAHVTCEM